MNATSTSPSITDTYEPEQIDFGSDFDPTKKDQFPPSLKPGWHDGFTFGLQTGEGYDKPAFETVERGSEGEKTSTLRVNYKATFDVIKKDGTTFEKSIYGKADFYESPKMVAAGRDSEGKELLRAVGATLTGKLTTDAVKAAFQAADGRTKFRAEIGWRTYDKDSGLTLSTNPRKGDEKQTPWPKDETGEFAAYATAPWGGAKVVGKLELLRVRKAKG